jgi:multiple antibiotic resistance protein
MGALDILVILFITIGPSKAAAMYLGMTAGTDPAFKRQVAIRTVTVAAIVCLVFVLFGKAILGMFHISLPALMIAGGLILFVFALHLVLGEDQDKAEEPGTTRAAPSLDIASYPLAVPLMASPQGLVAITTIGASRPGIGNALLMLALVGVVMAVNLVVLLSADKIFSRISPAVLKVTMRILGLLLCGLAVQLVIFGLAQLGVLPQGAGVRH